MTTPRAPLDAASLLKTVSPGLRSLVRLAEKVAAATYKCFDERTLVLGSGDYGAAVAFVLDLQTRLQDVFQAERDSLRKVKQLAWQLHSPADLRTFQQGVVWDGIWCLPEWQRAISALRASSGTLLKATAPTDSYLKTTAGYTVAWKQNGTPKWLPVGHELECTMEVLTACWLVLYFAGERLDHLWSDVLHIGHSRTGGLPSGVCIFKAYGDVYRHALQDMRDLQDFFKQKPALGISWAEYYKAHRPRIRHLMLKPSLFGATDIAEQSENVPQVDISPYCFRRLGGLYFMARQIAYIRSGYPITLIWLYQDDLESWNDKAKKWVKFATGRRLDTELSSCAVAPRGQTPTRGPKDHAFWAIKASNFKNVAMPACVLGVRHGVFTNHTDPSNPFSHMPFTGRRVVDDLFESMVTGIRGIAEKARLNLFYPDDNSQGANAGRRRDAAGVLTNHGEVDLFHDAWTNAYTPARPRGAEPLANAVVEADVPNPSRA